MFDKVCYKGTWLIGVSGGPDSMALLVMCLEAGLHVAVAHVNYHQREQAEEEELYVKQYCQEHQIPCFVKNAPFTYTHNFEAEARDWRYQFFTSLVEEHHFAGIMTAHHCDDLLETYIMQKERNVIPAYYGMQRYSLYHNIPLYRPLLDLTKKDLEVYCQQHQIKYYIDHTNLEPVHTRNVIRQDLAGYTKEEKEQLYVNMMQDNQKLREIREEADLSFLEGMLNLSVYCEKNEAVRLTALRKLVDPSRTMHCTKKYLQQLDYVICKEKDFCIKLGKKELVQCSGYAYMQDIPEDYEVILEEGDYPAFTVSNIGERTERTSYDIDELPLTVRNYHEGDRIRMRYGTKGINRFFIDRHIPKGERKRWPVVVNKYNEIILVPGLGCSADHWNRSYEVYVKHKYNERIRTKVIAQVK